MTNLIDDIKSYIKTAREKLDDFSIVVRTSDKNAVEDLGFIWSGVADKGGWEFGQRGTIDGVTVRGAYKAASSLRVIVIAVPNDPPTVNIEFEYREKEDIYRNFQQHFNDIIRARMELAEEKNYSANKFHIKAPYNLARILDAGSFHMTMGDDITTIQISGKTFHLILDNDETKVSIIHHYEHNNEVENEPIDYEEYLLIIGEHLDLKHLLHNLRVEVRKNKKYLDKYHLELNVSEDYEPLINRVSVDSSAGRFIYHEHLKTLIKVNTCVDLENEIKLAFIPKEREHVTLQ